MPQYVIGHRYQSARDGHSYGPWQAGDLVELTEAETEWLDQDSPGVTSLHVVKAAEPESAAEAEREQPPSRDRQAKGGRNRGV